MIKISIASDHRGYNLKEQIKVSLKDKFNFSDYGCNNSESCDYPDYASAAAKSVAEKTNEIAIVICGSGIGVNIAANKIKGIRCALIYDSKLAFNARAHDDANALALGSDYTDLNEAIKIIEGFVEASFEGGRHQRRVDKISELEK